MYLLVRHIELFWVQESFMSQPLHTFQRKKEEWSSEDDALQKQTQRPATSLFLLLKRQGLRAWPLSDCDSQPHVTGYWFESTWEAQYPDKGLTLLIEQED